MFILYQHSRCKYYLNMLNWAEKTSFYMYKCINMYIMFKKKRLWKFQRSILSEKLKHVTIIPLKNPKLGFPTYIRFSPNTLSKKWLFHKETNHLKTKNINFEYFVFKYLFTCYCPLESLAFLIWFKITKYSKLIFFLFLEDLFLYTGNNHFLIVY